MTNFEHIRCCDAPMELVREKAPMRMGARSAIIEVQRFRCGACDEILYSPEQMDAAQRTLARVLRAQEGLLGPEEVKSIREKHGLTQVQFEQLLGVGPKTVVRWERGTVFQSRAVDELIRMIDVVPGAFEFLAKRNGVEVKGLRPLDQSRPEPTVRFTLPPVEEACQTPKVLRMSDFTKTRQNKSVRLDEDDVTLLPTIPIEALK